MDAQELSALVDDLRVIGSDVLRYEVKSGIGKSVLETLSAFSNGDGGYVIVGLKESAGFTPVPEFQAQSQADALTEYGRRLTPRVRPEISFVSFEGSLVVVAYIPPMRPHDKPCFIHDRGRYGGSYIRTGDGDSRLEQYEVDRLIEEQRQPTWDKEPVPGASLSHLSEQSLQAFLAVNRESRPRTFADGDAVACERLSVTFQGEVTLAGLLALGEYPQEFFPRLTVTYAEFPGSTKGEVVLGERLLDKATFTGAIPELVYQVVEKIRSRIRTAAYVDGAFRYDLPDYPLVAVREAVTNALMHRDYSPESRGTPVQVSLFPDRLEIFNPGGLYGAVTMRQLSDRRAVSSARNQFLSTLLESTPALDGGIVAENRGTGIDVMFRALDHALMPPPQFRADISGFTVTFFLRRVEVGEKYPLVVERVREYLSGVTSASASELVSALQVSRSSVQNAINALLEQGEVVPTAPPRSPRRRYRLDNDGR